MVNVHLSLLSTILYSRSFNYCTSSQQVKRSEKSKSIATSGKAFLHDLEQCTFPICDALCLLEMLYAVIAKLWHLLIALDAN